MILFQILVEYLLRLFESTIEYKFKYYTNITLYMYFFMVLIIGCNIRNCTSCRAMKYYENPPAKSVCSLFKNCVNNTESTNLMDRNGFNKYYENIEKMESMDNFLFGIEKSGM